MTITSITRSVYISTFTNQTVWSSGQINVSDLHELSIDANVTYESAGNSIYFTVSRIGVDNRVYWMLNTPANSPLISSGNISVSLCAQTGYSFGDFVQIDLVNPTVDMVSATVSIKGKP